MTTRVLTLPDVPRFHRAALVVNTASRSGASAFDPASRLLRDMGVPLAEAHAVGDPTRLPDVVERATSGGSDLIVVGGGDGTISSAMPALVRQHATLGVLPLGTANDLARTLQIPVHLAAACEVIAHGKLVDVDLGTAGERHFLNVASLGLSVAVAQGLSSRLKRTLGPTAYPIALLRSFRGHVPFRARLEFPDGDHPALEVRDLLQVAVGNGRFYGGGNVVSPTAGIDDHLLDVYAIRTGRLRDYLGIARALRDGSFVDHINVDHLRTRRVMVLTEPDQLINADGELVATTPQMFGVHANALDVIVPEGSTAARLDSAAG